MLLFIGKAETPQGGDTVNNRSDPKLQALALVVAIVALIKALLK